MTPLFGRDLKETLKMKFRQLKEKLAPEPEEETGEVPEDETTTLPTEPSTEFPDETGDGQGVMGDEESKPDIPEGI